jgi:hypothetical protein
MAEGQCLSPIQVQRISFQEPGDSVNVLRLHPAEVRLNADRSLNPSRNEFFGVLDFLVKEGKET